MLKKIQKAYYHLFCHIYKFNERGPVVYWSEYKAVFLLALIVLFFSLSLVVYYTTFVDQSFRISNYNLTVLLFFLISFIPNYFIFLHRDRWEKMIKDFDKIPQKERKYQGWIVFGFITVIFLNLIFAFYQMSLVDWAVYR